MNYVPRPPTDHLLQSVCDRAGASEASVKNFFNRPARLSADMRQRIGAAVAEVGYRPARRVENALNGARIGYQLPRTWDQASPAMSAQFTGLVAATQRVGAVLTPFVVDSEISGVEDVLDGSPEERLDPVLGRIAWQRRYTSSLAPEVYGKIARSTNIKAFIVNDLVPDDPRLEMLRAHPEFDYLAFGYPGSEDHPYIETDNDRAIGVEVALLRRAGCRTFGHVGFADDDSIVPGQRRASVRKAVGRDIPTQQVHYADTGAAESATVGSLTTWIHEHPEFDAIICDSDKIAYLVHTAGKRAGRSMAQNPDALYETSNRTLMLTGNDNSEHRLRVEAKDRWMTLFGDSPSKMRTAVDLLARIRAGKAATTGVWVPPDIIGAPGRGWNDRIAELNADIPAYSSHIAMPVAETALNLHRTEPSLAASDGDDARMADDLLAEVLASWTDELQSAESSRADLADEGEGRSWKKRVTDPDVIAAALGPNSVGPLRVTVSDSHAATGTTVTVRLPLAQPLLSNVSLVADVTYGSGVRARIPLHQVDLGEAADQSGLTELSGKAVLPAQSATAHPVLSLSVVASPE